VKIVVDIGGGIAYLKTNPRMERREDEAGGWENEGFLLKEQNVNKNLFQPRRSHPKD
jgi:hypothetical protein